MSVCVLTHESSCFLLDGRGALDAQGDDCLSPEDNQPEHALHLLLVVLLLLVRLCLLALLGLDVPELLALADDEVHVLVEREQLADERAAVVERNLEPIPDQSSQAASLLLRLQEEEGGRVGGRGRGSGVE